MADIPTVADEIPTNAVQFRSDAVFTMRRYEYLIARRDSLIDRIRFGVLTLNAASLVALLAALGGDGHAAAWVGFNPTRARESAIGFVVGVVLAGIAAIIDSNLFRAEASDAFCRQAAATRLAALYEAPASVDAHEAARTATAEYYEAPLVDFHYSAPALWLQNFAAGAWLFGILVPLAAAVGWR